MGYWSKVKKAYTAADPTGLLPGGQNLTDKDWYKAIDVTGILPGGQRPFWEGPSPEDVDPEIRAATMQGYMAPTETAAYKAMAEQAAIKSAAQKQATAAAYARRGLGQSGYATAAEQQVTMNEQQAMNSAIARIQLAHLSAITGIREQDLAAMAANEQNKAAFFGGAMDFGSALLSLFGPEALKAMRPSGGGQQIGAFGQPQGAAVSFPTGNE